MLTYLKNIRDVLQRSIWFIPLLCSLLGLALSQGLVYIDSFLWEKAVPYLGTPWGIDFESVRSLFSGIVSVIITTMTTILSITLLIYTVLAGQYGAHILRVLKMRAFSKFAIGWFAGTYTYLISNLFLLSQSNDLTYLPQITTSAGLILSVSTIFLLIAYVHFLVRQIQSGTVIMQISQELHKTINALEDYSPEYEERKQSPSPTDKNLSEQNIYAKTYGYVQNIDKSSLKSIAEKNNLTIKSHYRSGEFVLTGSTIFTLYGTGEVSKEAESELHDALILGEKRIPIDDLEYSLEQLVEMALKALSPSVNALLVARNCIDHIGESIAILCKRQFPDGAFYNDQGRLLLITKEFTFEGYLRAALDPIRQYSADHCYVSIRCLDILIKIIETTKVKHYKNLLIENFKSFYEESYEIYRSKSDKVSFEKRYQQFANLTREIEK